MIVILVLQLNILFNIIIIEIDGLRTGLVVAYYLEAVN